MRLAISGMSFNAACDPRVSSVPVAENWPAPKMVKRGRGWQYVYEADEELAEQIASHMEAVGSGFVETPPDAETAREGRVLLRDASRVRALTRDVARIRVQIQDEP